MENLIFFFFFFFPLPFLFQLDFKSWHGFNPWKSPLMLFYHFFFFPSYPRSYTTFIHLLFILFFPSSNFFLSPPPPPLYPAFLPFFLSPILCPFLFLLLIFSFLDFFNTRVLGKEIDLVSVYINRWVWLPVHLSIPESFAGRHR